MEDILGCDQAPSTVVLSACQTGLGIVNPGDNLEGLTQAFLLAGAQSVVSTLWAIDPVATSVFMENFYQGLSVAGVSPARALQIAQVNMMRSVQWNHPYFWAGFILNSLI